MKEKKSHFWDDVLNGEKILSDEEAEDIRRITIKFRKKSDNKIFKYQT